MTNLAATMNDPATRVYRQALRDKVRTLLNDPAITGEECRAGCKKLDTPGRSIEALERWKTNLLKLITQRRDDARLKRLAA
jgi:hypothetical protein